MCHIRLTARRLQRSGEHFSTSTAIGIAFPYELLLCVRINYYYGPINYHQQRGGEDFGGTGRGLVDQHLDLDLLSVSTITMFPYQLLLCFRINDHYGPIKCYLQRGGEHFGGTGGRLVDKDSDRNRLLAPLPLGAVLGPLPVSAWGAEFRDGRRQ